MSSCLANGASPHPPDVPVCEPFAWGELAALWDTGDFGGVHDWLGLRWNHLIQTRPAGHEDHDARFLQGLAFAALAFHFTQNGKQDGAALMADDALRILPGYTPAYRGMDLEPVLQTLRLLRPMLDGLAPEDDCPVQPFAFNPLSYRRVPQ